MYAAMPGRMTISAPRKLTNTAAQLRRLETSLRKITAKIEPTIGIRKVIAATSATGDSDSAPNRHHILTTEHRPRTTCRPSRLVFNAPTPTFISHGSMNNSPNRLRRKAISKTCSESARWRTMAADAE